MLTVVLTSISAHTFAESGSIADAEAYDSAATYPTPGTRVAYTEEDALGVIRAAIFSNSWYINPGNAPTFYPSSTGWVKVGPTIILANAEDTSGDIENNPAWNANAAYTGGNIVS